MVYSVTTSPTFANWADGLTIVLRASGASAGGDTLSLNGATAVPILQYSSSSISNPVAANAILAGGLYLLIWDASQKAWILT